MNVHQVPLSLTDTNHLSPLFPPTCSAPTTYLGGTLGRILGLPPMLLHSCASLIDAINALYLATLLVITSLLIWLSRDPHYAHLDIGNSGFVRGWKRLILVTGAIMATKAVERMGPGCERVEMVVGVAVVVAVVQGCIWMRGWRVWGRNERAVALGEENMAREVNLRREMELQKSDYLV